MSPVSVKKTQQQYLSVVQKLEGKLLHLRSRRETMDTRAFVVLDEGGTSVHPTPGLDEQPELYHGEVRICFTGATHSRGWACIQSSHAISKERLSCLEHTISSLLGWHYPLIVQRQCSRLGTKCND